MSACRQPAGEAAIQRRDPTTGQEVDYDARRAKIRTKPHHHYPPSTMSFLFRTCLDGHHCENGSSCLEHPLEEGTYYCDCTTSSGDFAGLFCEYEAETYCQLPQETESTWFCANDGTCVLATSGGDGRPSQWKCDCPADYEGPVSCDATYTGRGFTKWMMSNFAFLAMPSLYM